MSVFARCLRLVAIALLTILMLIVGLVWWLIGTNSGAHFLFDQLRQRVPGSMTVASIEGSLLSSLRFSGFDFATDAVSLQVRTATVQISPSVLTNFRHVNVRELRLDGVDIRLPATAEASASSTAIEDIVVGSLPDIALPVRLSFDVLALSDVNVLQSGKAGALFVLDSFRLTGEMDRDVVQIDSLALDTGNVAGTLSGELATSDLWPAVLEATWRYDNHNTRGTLEVSGDRNGYRVSHALEDPRVPEPVLTNGLIRVPSDVPVSVELTTTTALLKSPQLPTVLEQVVVSVAGKPSEWAADASANISDDTAGEGVLNIAAEGSTQALSLQSLELRLAEGGAVTLSGEMASIAQPRFEGQISIQDLPWKLVLPETKGSVSGEAVLRASISDKPEAAVEDLSLTGAFNGFPLSASGQASWTGAGLTSDGLVLRLGENTLKATGRIHSNRESLIDVVLDAGELQQVFPDVSGGVTGTIALRGSLSAPSVSAELQSRGISLKQTEIGQTSLSVDWKGEDGKARLAIARVASPEVELGDVTLSVEGVFDRHRILYGSRINRDYRVRFDSRGGWNGRRWIGVVNSIALEQARIKDGAQASDPSSKPDEREPESLVRLRDAVGVTVGPGALQIDKFCLDAVADSYLCGSVVADASRLASAGEIAMTDLDTLVRALLPEWRIVGGFSGDWSLQREGIEWRGAANILSDSLSLARRVDNPDVDPLEIRPLRFSARFDDNALTGQLEATMVQLGNLRGDVTITDPDRPDARVDGKLRGTFNDPARFNALLTAARLHGGNGELTFDISGTRQNPVAEGYFRLSDIDADIVPLGITLDDLTADWHLTQARRVEVETTARSGGGTVALSGGIDLTGENAFSLRARLDAQSASIIQLPDISATASAGLDLQANADGYRLTGNIGIDEALVRVRELPQSAVTVSADSKVFDSEGNEIRDDRSATLRGELALTTVLSDKVRLEGFGLESGLTGRLEIRQKAGRLPTGTGVLELTDAVYAAYGQRLDVSRGRLLFSGPLDSPQLDIRAQREVAPYTVGIDVTGTPQRLQSDLFSTPALADAEAFSLLLTGRNLAEVGEGDGADLSGAAIALGLRQAFSVTDGLRDAIGLDTLTYTGSGREGRLLAGKSLSSRLYLQYAYGVFDQISSVLLRLKINQRLSLESASGDTQSVDLIYSVGTTR